MTTYEFFLGGNDAEMEEIKKIALGAGCIVHDKNLEWGAKTSYYKKEMERIVQHNRKFNDVPMDCIQSSGALSHTPIIGVPVELENATITDGWWHNSTYPLNCACDFYAIDHHGKRSGEPPAIIQVCDLLGVTPTRKQCLIGAMDAGYIYGLEAIGASLSEIREFLGAPEESETVSNMLLAGLPADRKNEVEAAIHAVETAEHLDDLIIVKLPHNWTAPVSALLHGKQKFQNYLILSEWEEDGKTKREANYYADGDRIRKVAEIVSGWTGGAGLMPLTIKSVEFWSVFGGCAPNNAFWGCSGKQQGDVLKAVMSVN